MAIYSEFSHEKWWFSIVRLVYQMVRMIVPYFSLQRGDFPAIPVPSSRSRWGTQGHLPLLASLACTGHRIAGDDLHGSEGCTGSQLGIRAASWEGVLLQFDHKLVKEYLTRWQMPMIAYEAEDLNSHKRVCVCNNWDRLFSKIDSTTNKDWPPQTLQPRGVGDDAEVFHANEKLQRLPHKHSHCLYDSICHAKMDDTQKLNR